MIIDTTAPWDEALYDMPEKDIRDYVKRNAKLSGIVYVEYNYRQLGKDEQWLDEVSTTLLYDQKKIKREVHLKRMHGSSQSPFDQDDLDALNDLVREPSQTYLMLDRFKIDIYDKIDKNKIYFIGIDCSASIGRDSNAITIVDPYTEKPVAEYKSPYISSPDFVRLVYAIMKELTPRAVLCIERNHVGTTLIQNLLETEFANNIYYETADVTNIDDKLDPDGFLKAEASNRRIRGIWTGPKSRQAMMKILETYVHEHKEKFVTKNITQDIGKLIYTRSERIDHAPGSHDDSLMSYMMVLYVLHLGKSLHHFGYVRGLSEEDYQRGLVEEETDKSYEVLNEMYGEGYFVKPREANEVSDEFQAAKDAAEQQRLNILAAMGNSMSQGAFERRLDVDNGTTNIPMSFFDDLNS